jgi:predicted ATPase with chaperone activity
MSETSNVVHFNPAQGAGRLSRLESLLPTEADPFAPVFPQRLEDLDVSPSFLADLALKTVSVEPDCTTSSIAAKMHLGLIITDALLSRLHADKLIERKGVAVGLHNHHYAMLDRGWAEVKRLMEQSSYIGPAPVSLKSYTDALLAQVESRPPATRSALEHAMNDLVLSDAAKETLGLVASSGRSLFLSGPSGNGKTAIARSLVNAVPGNLWIPYAIEVDRQVIRLFDPHNHQPVKLNNNDADRRWVKIRPPLVVVGGELTLDSLELNYTDTQRFYEAPFQLKSNGGVLVVDDLGRQRCSAAELLNRWIIPLENRIDYLTLSTGKKIQVPFEQVIVFATNLTGADLTDEAFLRRMGYRLYMMSPGPETYAEIFMKYARSHGLAVDPAILPHLEKRYGIERREPKSCEPRDLIDRAIEVCKYRREQVRLTKETVDAAWSAYFGASASG